MLLRRIRHNPRRAIGCALWLLIAVYLAYIAMSTFIGMCHGIPMVNTTWQMCVPGSAGAQ